MQQIYTHSYIGEKIYRAKDITIEDFIINEHLEKFIRRAVVRRKNIFISGSKGVGKSTFMSCFIDRYFTPRMVKKETYNIIDDGEEWCIPPYLNKHLVTINGNTSKEALLNAFYTSAANKEKYNDDLYNDWFNSYFKYKFIDMILHLSTIEDNKRAINSIYFPAEDKEYFFPKDTEAFIKERIETHINIFDNLSKYVEIFLKQSVLQKKNIFISGDPYSGKTTLLTYLIDSCIKDTINKKTIIIGKKELKPYKIKNSISIEETIQKLDNLYKNTKEIDLNQTSGIKFLQKSNQLTPNRIIIDGIVYTSYSNRSINKVNELLKYKFCNGLLATKVICDEGNAKEALKFDLNTYDTNIKINNIDISIYLHRRRISSIYFPKTDKEYFFPKDMDLFLQDHKVYEFVKHNNKTIVLENGIETTEHQELLEMLQENVWGEQDVFRLFVNRVQELQAEKNNSKVI